MQTASTNPVRLGRLLRVRVAALLILGLALTDGVPGWAATPRSAVKTRSVLVLAATGAQDAGAMPESQPLTLTLRLGPTAAQTATLDTLLSAQTQIGSLMYHRWLTTAAFAASFGASDADVASVRGWLESEGLSVLSVSASRTRLVVSGPAGRIESAFQVGLRRVSADGAAYFANVTQPSVPPQVASIVTGISGLDDLPSEGLAHVRLAASGTGVLARSVPPAGTNATAEPESKVAVTPPASGPDVLNDLADAVDANAQSVIQLVSTACTTQIAESDVDGIRDVLRQAQAQGMTVLSSSGCAESTQASAANSFPSALAEVTAVTLAPVPDALLATTGLEMRPAWQVAAGLPADQLRHEPDLTTSSLAALAQTVLTLSQETGGRVGNLNSTLYGLAKTPGLFSKAQSEVSARAVQAEGTWDASSGLGVISLAKLLEAYPRGSNTTQVSLVSSSYAIGYGDTFTLTAKVLPNSYGATGPTGTITFTSSTQGVLGSTSIDSSGTATLTPDVLPVGVYSVTASYSGDGNYSGAASTSKVTITISSVNAKLLATVSPQTNVPYGATATVTATVNLPGAGAAPSGTVSAQIEGVTGALFSATLSPNPGGNSATANIVVSVPSPGSYNLQVTCQGNSNFQCQTPINLPVTAVKGYTNTTVSVTPAAPQAGQPISLTATVANAGNGTGTYTYNGSVAFYDSGKLLATAPVATNQATTTLSLSGNRTHNIIAIYTGDSNWNTSTSGAVAVSPTILPDELTIASNVSGSSSLSGVNLIFTGTTTTNITFGVGPTGTVRFFDTFNGAVVQLGNPAVLVANGPTASIALFKTTGLLPGTHNIYAQYTGDDNYAAATSPVLQLTLSDFNVSMTPTSLALAQGKSQQVTVFVGGSGGFTGTVSLGCTPPASSEATCAFSPSAVSGGGLTTLTITTTAPRSAARRPLGGEATLLSTAAGSSLAALFLLWLPAGSRRRIPLLLAALLVVSVSVTLGCGLGVSSSNTGTNQNSGSGTDSGSGASADPGTPFGTQNFVITAAGSDGVNTIRHTYQYQVTVQ